MPANQQFTALRCFILDVYGNRLSRGGTSIVRKCFHKKTRVAYALKTLQKGDKVLTRAWKPILYKCFDCYFRRLIYHYCRHHRKCSVQKWGSCSLWIIPTWYTPGYIFLCMWPFIVNMAPNYIANVNISEFIEQMELLYKPLYCRRHRTPSQYFI